MTRLGAAACGSLCLAIGTVAIASRIPALARVEVVLVLVLLSHLTWLAAVHARPQRLVVLGVTAILVLLCMCANPVAEDDYWRFLWDGYRNATDASPYGRPPADWFGDESLPREMQRVLDGINYPEVPTIYGPLLQALFAAAHAIAPADPRGLAVLFGLLHLSCVALAMRRLPAHRVAMVAWNPLLLQQCLMNLHPDFLLGWLMLAVVLAARRGAAARAGALLAVAAAIKIPALLAAPTAWIAATRGRPTMIATLIRGAAACGLVLGALYAPFLGPGGSDAMGLAAFARDWTFNPALFAVLAWGIGDPGARIFAAVLAAAIGVWVAVGVSRSRAAAAVVLALGALLALAPVINPWYLTWLLPLATLTRWHTPWVAAAALMLSTLTVGELGMPGDPFAIPAPVAAAQWLIVAAALAVDARAHRRRTHATIRASESASTQPRSSAPSGYDPESPV